MSNSKCEKCLDGYYFDLQTIKCISIHDFESNCDLIQEKTSCSVCELGYYLINDECKECADK